MLENRTYSIGDAAKLSGASQKQIRNWEAKGYIPEAERVVAGDRSYRRFTPEDVELMGPHQRLCGRGVHPFGRRRQSRRHQIKRQGGELICITSPENFAHFSISSAF